jgi:hypothetical protein
VRRRSSIFREEVIGFARPLKAEKWHMMYRSASLVRGFRGSSDEFTIVAILALLGLALSLLAIEKGLIDPEYMANLLLLF